MSWAYEELATQVLSVDSELCLDLARALSLLLLLFMLVMETEVITSSSEEAHGWGAYRQGGAMEAIGSEAAGAGACGFLTDPLRDKPRARGLGRH
jgi:hypothetical protein